MLCFCRYMIVDLKRFTPGSDLPAGLLWVAEQIPGLVASGDVTEQLARGYWPSYNIPYFPEASSCSQHLSALHPPHSFYPSGHLQRACIVWPLFTCQPLGSFATAALGGCCLTPDDSCPVKAEQQICRRHVTGQCCRHGLTCALPGPNQAQLG